MEMRNCVRCGRLFAYKDTPLCDVCIAEDEKLFEVVKEYLRENPKSKITEITRDTGVSVKRLNKYLQEGRLEITEGIDGFLKCLGCGTSIKTGKYCESCAKKFSDKVKAVFSPIQEESGKGGAKMHYLRRGREDN